MDSLESHIYFPEEAWETKFPEPDTSGPNPLYTPLDLLREAFYENTQGSEYKWDNQISGVFHAHLCMIAHSLPQATESYAILVGPPKHGKTALLKQYPVIVLRFFGNSRDSLYMVRTFFKLEYELGPLLDGLSMEHSEPIECSRLKVELLHTTPWRNDVYWDLYNDSTLYLQLFGEAAVLKCIERASILFHCKHQHAMASLRFFLRELVFGAKDAGSPHLCVLELSTELNDKLKEHMFNEEFKLMVAVDYTQLEGKYTIKYHRVGDVCANSQKRKASTTNLFSCMLNGCCVRLLWLEPGRPMQLTQHAFNDFNSSSLKIST